MSDIQQNIRNSLDEIERKEHVKILHCVESGSRSWGFASPDSDYDVRFIYLRERDAYLNLSPPRDVIEWQLDDVYDISDTHAHEYAGDILTHRPPLSIKCHLMTYNDI